MDVSLLWQDVYSTPTEEGNAMESDFVRGLVLGAICGGALSAALIWWLVNDLLRAYRKQLSYYKAEHVTTLQTVIVDSKRREAELVQLYKDITGEDIETARARKASQ